MMTEFVIDTSTEGRSKAPTQRCVPATDPLSGVASAMRANIHSRIAVEDSEEVNDAFFDAAEVVVAQMRGATERMVEKFDTLLANLLTTFPERPDLHELRYAVPNSRGYDVQPVRSSVMPVAIVTELLMNWKIRLDMRRVPHWRNFAKRYGAILLAS